MKKILRIGFFYPKSSMPNPLDPSNLWKSSRGMTGSEGSFVHYAKCMADAGHSVTVFTNITAPAYSEGIHWSPYDSWFGDYSKQEWDALCSWMTPEPLKVAPTDSFRVFDQQVSDFSCCEPGWENYVDLLMPLSNSHAHYLTKYTGFPRDKWRVAHNGVDTSEFKPSPKTKGKVIWASSHDRGLHWLLEAWPKILQRSPHANLHIFYNFNGLEVFSRMENMDSSTESGRRFNELGQRSRYTLEAIRRLSDGYDVHTHKSVSRERMKQEMASSEVLGYPLNPIHYTETFGVTVLEAMACGTVPVICSDDCFKELWSMASVCVDPPYYDHKDEYIDKFCQILNDEKLLEEKSDRGRLYSKNFDWDILGKKFEKTLLTRGESGFIPVDWCSSS